MFTSCFSYFLITTGDYYPSSQPFQWCVLFVSFKVWLMLYKFIANIVNLVIHNISLNLGFLRPINNTGNVFVQLDVAKHCRPANWNALLPSRITTVSSCLRSLSPISSWITSWNIKLKRKFASSIRSSNNRSICCMFYQHSNTFNKITAYSFLGEKHDNQKTFLGLF